MKKLEGFINQISVSMGAGASTFNQSMSSSPFFRPSSRDPVPTCEACSVPFTTFKRKKLCCVCNNAFCSSCVIRGTDGRRTCNKCRIFSSHHPTRNELMQLKVRDLRQYLNIKNVRMDGCREKKDLVELIMRNSGGQSQSDHHQEQLQAHQEWVEELVRQHQETQTDEGQNTSPNHSPPVEESHQESPRHSPPILTAQWPPFHTAEVTHSAEQMHTVQEVHETTPESDEPDRPAPPRRMTLEQIQQESDIDELSVRQLKEVLANNFVDYKGCCEKRELIERTKRLWNENQRQWQRLHSKKKNRPGASSQIRTDSQTSGDSSSPVTPNDPGVPPPSYEDCLKNYTVHGEATQSDPVKPPAATPAEEDDEEGLCKICMDAPIDCVLLECGHFVACTKCGKRLAECPICRQYVVRAVHIFRA